MCDSPVPEHRSFHYQVKEVQPNVLVGDATRVVPTVRSIPGSETAIAVTELVESFISSASVTTLILECTTVMVSSSSWEELIVLLLSGAACFTEFASVSAVQVGTPYRKRRAYVVAVLASCRRNVQLQAWKRCLRAYAVSCPPLGHMLGWTKTYCLGPTGQGKSIHTLEEPMSTLSRSRLARDEPRREGFTPHEAGAGRWEEAVELGSRFRESSFDSRLSRHTVHSQ